MVANFKPGDDGDWTEANIRDAAAKLYEVAVGPAHEAFQVSWQAYVAATQGTPRAGVMPKDMSGQYAAYWRAYGMQVIEDRAVNRAEMQARRLVGLYPMPTGEPDPAS